MRALVLVVLLGCDPTDAAGHFQMGGRSGAFEYMTCNFTDPCKPSTVELAVTPP